METLKRRLARIGIDLEFVSNYPWVYLHKINGRVVEERYLADHGFTVGFLPIRADQSFRFTDLKVIFKLIRKYT
jgi:hypothetical protein